MRVTVTYIGHSGFLVETEHLLLLFDYYQGELPVLPKEKPCFVFASHRHQDHFNPAIFNLADTHPRIHYILSSDIWQSRIPESLREQSVRLKPGTSWSVQDSLLSVTTLRSTDEGVAFLLQCGGLTIYHAGDLNDWRWEGEPEDWNRQMARHYREYLEPLRNRSIDLAFIPLDPRQEDHYCLGMDYFLELTRTGTIFPMHCWEDYSIIGRWLKEHPDSPYKDRIVTVSRQGEQFSLTFE